MNSVKQSPTHSMSYIPGVDGLRALAVLAVMLFHIDSSILPGGFSGVDVFFVISGYVVSLSLSRDQSPNFWQFTINFYNRRILRIFPALIACLVIVSIFTALFIPASWLSNTNSETALYAYFGLSNFALVWFDDGYFSLDSEFNPFLHTWSLGVEEQFYVIFPLLFFTWLKFKDQPNIGGFIVNWLLVILLVSSLLFSIYETSNHPNNAFFLLPSRFWELACGALLFKLHARNKWTPDSGLNIRLTLILGTILVSIGLVFSNKNAFPFPWALFSVIGTMLLISGLSNRDGVKSLIQNIFENPVVVYIGKISYSLYLWHWAVYVLFRWTVGLESMLQIGCAVVLAIVLAVLSYHYIETPIRKNKVIGNRPYWQVVTGGLVTIVLAFTFSWGIFKYQHVISHSVVMQDKTDWYTYGYKKDIAQNYQSALEGRKLFVVGDSHVGAYATMLYKLAGEYGVEVHRFGAGGCGVANLRKPGMFDRLKCKQRIEEKLTQIEELASPGDIVLLASLRMNYLDDDNRKMVSNTEALARQLGVEADTDRKLALQEAEEFIKRFEKLSLHFIFDAPMPIFKYLTFRCSDWFNESNLDCSHGPTLERDFLLDYRAPVMQSLSSLQSKFPSVIVWDPFPILCKTEVCSVYDQDKPLFFDDNHLSAHGNRVLYPSFVALLKKIWKAEQEKT